LIAEGIVSQKDEGFVSLSVYEGIVSLSEG
jgi:hypothetical protein